MEVSRQGRRVVIDLADERAAAAVAGALSEEALRALEVVGRAREQGEGAEWRVVWREGDEWEGHEAIARRLEGRT